MRGYLCLMLCGACLALLALAVPDSNAGEITVKVTINTENAVSSQGAATEKAAAPADDDFTFYGESPARYEKIVERPAYYREAYREPYREVRYERVEAETECPPADLEVYRYSAYRAPVQGYYSAFSTCGSAPLRLEFASHGGHHRGEFRRAEFGGRPPQFRTPFRSFFAGGAAEVRAQRAEVQAQRLGLRR